MPGGMGWQEAYKDVNRPALHSEVQPGDFFFGFRPAR